MGFASAAVAAVPQGREGVRDPAAGQAGPGRPGGALTQRPGAVRPPAGTGAAAEVEERGPEIGAGPSGGCPVSRCRQWMCGWREGMMLAGPQLVAGPAAPGGERARLLSLYVQDYLECVESLPLDIQRNVSLLREVDTRCQGGLRDSASVAGQREGREGPEGRAARGERPPAAHALGAGSGAPGCGPSPGPLGGRRHRRGAAFGVRRGGAPPLVERGAGAAEPPRPALGPGLPSRRKTKRGVEREASDAAPRRRRGCSLRARGAELRHGPPLAARLGTLRWSNRSNRSSQP